MPNTSLTGIPCTSALGLWAWVTDVDGAGDGERGEGAVDVNWDGPVAKLTLLEVESLVQLQLKISSFCKEEWEKERKEGKKTYELLQFFFWWTEWSRVGWSSKLTCWQVRMQLEDGKLENEMLGTAKGLSCVESVEEQDVTVWTVRNKSRWLVGGGGWCCCRWFRMRSCRKPNGTWSRMGFRSWLSGYSTPCTEENKCSPGPGPLHKLYRS